jgi:hypothetical protein
MYLDVFLFLPLFLFWPGPFPSFPPFSLFFPQPSRPTLSFSPPSLPPARPSPSGLFLFPRAAQQAQSRRPAPSQPNPALPSPSIPHSQVGPARWVHPRPRARLGLDPESDRGMMPPPPARRPGPIEAPSAIPIKPLPRTLDLLNP